MINIFNKVQNLNSKFPTGSRSKQNIQDTLQMKRNYFLNRKRSMYKDNFKMQDNKYLIDHNQENIKNSEAHSIKTQNSLRANKFQILAERNNIKISDNFKDLKTPSLQPSTAKIDLTSIFSKDLSFSEIEPLLKTIENYREYFRIKNRKFYDDFTFDEILSKGSFGVILKGKSKKFRKNFAFKIIFNKSILQQKREHSLRKIKNEISILYKLKHRLINAFYGFYEIGDTFCFVLEHEKYGDLSNFIKNLKRQTLSETLIAFIAIQLLKGLDFCHQNKIAHLDIKKHNILVDENLNFKICDFSVSAEYGEDDVKLNCIGSSLYISPENLQRSKISSEDFNKVDIYSFGVLLFNLAFKSYPFNLSMEDSTNFEVIAEKINDEQLIIQEKSSHSELFRNFLNGMLQKDIHKRFSIKEALSHPWIKASESLLEEKEKNSDLEKFLITLVTDNAHSFSARRNIDKNYA